MSLVLAALGVACGDQPLEVVPDREVEEGAGLTRAPGWMADATASEDGLVISTDKDDYQPGDTVNFTGSGWPANDTLDILLEDEPATHEPHSWWVPVGEDGTFRDSTYVVDNTDLDVTFTLTATSRAGGRSLAVQFTDANIGNDLGIAPATASVVRGGFVDYTITVTFGGNTTPCTAPLSVAGLSSGTTGVFTPTSVTGHSDDTPKTSTLRITTTGTTPLGPDGFTVTASTGAGCTGANRNVNGTINVSGPATKVVFGQQPTNEESATPIAPAVTVRVLDASNNLVGNSSAPITLAIGTNPGSGTLSGTLTQNAVNGVATFANLSIDKIGTGYTLVATSPGLTSATSNGFNITLGPASQLAFFTQPSGGVAGAAFGTQPRVEVQDAGGNRRNAGSGSNAPITLAIVPGTGTAGAALTCTTNPLNAVAGLATFAGCRINLDGTDYRLRATSGTLTSADSDPFDITPANQPPTVDAGGPYTVAEGTAQTLTPTVNDPDGNPLIYTWTVNTAGIDAGGACTFDNASIKNPKVTCTDDSQGASGGKFTLTLQVSDGIAPAVNDNADLTVTNADPVANAGGPYSGNEGAEIQLNGSGDDPGNNDDAHLGYQWTAVATGIDAGGACTFDNAASKNAKVTCTDDGSFKVSLVVSDDDGGTSVASEATLTVANVAPTATAGGPYSGEEGSEIQLGGSGDDPGNNDDPDLTYQWTAITTGIDPGGACTFDDATKKNAKVTCTDDGSFQVRLVAKDDDGGTSTASDATLTVGNAGPVANAGPDYTGSEGTAVQLNGSVTDAGTNDTHVWSWHYVAGSGVDAGASCTFTSATAEDPKITCTDDGVVELTLKVTDDDGAESTDKALLTLSNVAPVADAGGPYNAAVEGTAVTLSGSATDKGSNDTHTYQWTVDDSGITSGGSCTFDSNVAQNPKLTCSDNGTATATLVVTDDDGAASAESHATVTVANADPVANAGPDYDGFEGTAVQLNGSVTDAGANDTHTWSWKYVAGSGVDAGASCSFSNASAEDPTITCTDDGVVELTLKVTDDDGGEGTDEALLTLANVAPVANAGGPYGNGVEGSAITLSGSATDKGANDSHTFKWTVDDSGITSGGSCAFDSDIAQNPKLTCDDNGTATVTLVATDDDGAASAESHASVTVANADPVANAGPDYTGSEGTGVKLNGSFTDAGANDTHTWTWKYVAGTGVDAGATCSFSDASLDPYITCTDDGVVELTLTVTDDDGGEGSDKATLTLANVAPVAEAGGPYTSIEGSAFTLNGSATDKGANDVISYKWTADVSDLNGGGCSFDNDTKKNAEITCTDNGVVTLTLKATDDDGDHTTDQTTLTLANADPVANAGPDYTGSEGTGVKLNGSFTDAGGNDTHTWAWKYVAGTGVDAGATCSFSDATLDPYITCTDDGVVELTLTVTDDDGGEGSDQATLTLSNVAPVANAGGPYTAVAEGGMVGLTGSATDKGANDTRTYKWTLDASGIDGGGTCSIGNDTQAATTVSCNDNGTLKVTLVATDDDGGVSAGSQATITFNNANPAITAFTKADGTALPTTLIVAGTLGLKVAFGDAGTNDSHTLEVDCGSGTFALPVPAASPATGSCTFPAIGSTTIRVKVADDDNGYHILSHTILVKYDFVGFSAPVDRPTTMNVSKAGQAIPLKWTLKNANGTPVTDLATVTVRAVNMACALGSTDDLVEEYAAGASGLQNFGDGRYQFNWKTPTSYASSCKSIELVFAAGGVSYTEGPHAFFSFKK
jgi:hypothetical protein